MDKNLGEQAKCPMDKNFGEQAKCPMDKKVELHAVALRFRRAPLSAERRGGRLQHV
jgi:hypothetical protein